MCGRLGTGGAGESSGGCGRLSTGGAGELSSRGTTRSVTRVLMNARTVRHVRERTIACTSIRAAMILFR